MSVRPTLSGGGLLGHLRELRDDPLGLQRRFVRECGDAGILTFPGARLLVVNSPELAGALLVGDAAKFRKSRLLRAALFPLVGDGLFTSEGPLWRRQRKLMARLFPPSHLASYADAMIAEAARCARTWADGAEIDIARETTRITMGIAGKALFDADTFDDSDELGDALTVLLEHAAASAASVRLAFQVELAGALERRLPRLAAGLERPLWLPRRCRRALAIVERRVGQMIADRRARPSDRDDLLSRLLRAHDDDGGMSERQLRDEIVTLFVAGHETTATGLAWTLYLLGRDPATYARVVDEVRADRDLAIGATGLPPLPLTLAVFSEALRLYPPVPVFERQAIAPVELAGQQLAVGDYAAVLPWALHHRPALWPEPERFEPARFEPAAVDARARHAFLPFGAGPRVCLGAHFAMLEAALVLATVLRQVDLTLVEPTAEVVPDPRAATLRPAGAIRMRVARRAARA